MFRFIYYLFVEKSNNSETSSTDFLNIELDPIVIMFENIQTCPQNTQSLKSHVPEG